MAPKRQALEEANAELAEAQAKLTMIKNKIAVSAPQICIRKMLEPQVLHPWIKSGQINRYSPLALCENIHIFIWDLGDDNCTQMFQNVCTNWGQAY